MILPQNNSSEGDSSNSSYFVRRRKIYTRAVQGRYRRLKWLVMIATLGVYYLAPLLRWDRGPNAPDQAILIDLNHARAYWFFIEIWPQEIYYITAILIFAAISLFFVTSLLGRVWCGYFCPQTVWTDLFTKVEMMVQGDRGARKRLDESPISFEKIWKKTLTHLIWVLIALSTGGAFVFYFNDAPTLWHQVITFDVPPMVMMFVVGLTFSTYLMAGFAREQVCIYMCPYSRFQSGMFDRDTLIIAYDPARGEPRGPHKKNQVWESHGHCIDCSACVQVCPVGIDIRNGLQIECIACGLCVDACNNIMDKVGLPHGLIRYDSDRNMRERGNQRTLWKRLFRPRSYYYTAVLLVVAGLVIYNLVTRAPFELHVLHDRNPLFVQLSDGWVRNGYDVRIFNKTHQKLQFQVSVSGIHEADLSLRSEAVEKNNTVNVPPDSVGQFRYFLKAPSQKKAQTDIVFKVEEVSDKGGFAAHPSVFISKGK